MKRLFFLVAAVIHTVYASTIYDTIEEIPYDPHGWFLNEAQLNKIFREKNITSVIELGSWAGSSALYFGEKLNGKGVVLAIDSWIGEGHEAYLEDTRHTYIYHLFLSNVKHMGLEEVIVPIKMTTDEAAVALDFQADLIYVDGDHSTRQVMIDILNWHPHLNEGGIMCGDDWYWESVREGVKKAAKKLGYKIESEENFWRLRKPAKKPRKMKRKHR